MWMVVWLAVNAFFQDGIMRDRKSIIGIGDWRLAIGIYSGPKSFGSVTK